MWYAVIMMIYAVPYAPIPNKTALLTLMPPARRMRYSLSASNTGPLFAYALLAFALERQCSLDAQKVVYTDGGKPYLPGHPVCFSLSHSKTHALCVLADRPVGCDIEAHRPVTERIRHRILAPIDASTDFFAHWTLKESYVKLTGDLERPFSSIAFALTENHAAGPDSYGWIYREIPDCTAAVLSHAPFSRPDLTLLAAEVIFDYAAEK